jgi:hypothetical protein
MPGTAAETTKRSSASARLVLPFFEVDMANPQGTTTFFAVRNESTVDVELRTSYFAADRPANPLHVDTTTLGGKAVLTVDVRIVPQLLVDADGFARGYAVIEALTEGAIIQGDRFQLTPGQGFATGSRLLNADPASRDNDLCSLFTMRFLNGGGFDGGTELVFWLDLDSFSTANPPRLHYSVYNQAGELRFSAELPASGAAFKRTVASLVAVLPTNFGALEIELPDGMVGHVSGVMSALGLYSVGFEAACRD